MNKPALPSIPVFKLYGESLDWPTPDLLHCETISSRSREHQWEIKPHRHADLCQLLFVFKGQAELEIEGQRTQLETPAIQVLPPLSVHGFRFSEDVEGFIVTLATPLINHLQAQLGDSVHALARAETTRPARMAIISTACFQRCRPSTTAINRRGKCSCIRWSA